MAAITQLRFGLSGMPYGSFAGKGVRTVERLTQMRFGLSWRLGGIGAGGGGTTGPKLSLGSAGSSKLGIARAGAAKKVELRT